MPVPRTAPVSRAAQLAVALAVLNLALRLTALVATVSCNPGYYAGIWDELLVWYLPVLGLGVAAALVWRDHTPARYAVVAAGLLALPGAVVLANDTTGRVVFFYTGAWAQTVREYSVSAQATVSATLTALAAAAAGWWGRRGERAADPDG